jgi:TolA-binding protein
MDDLAPEEQELLARAGVSLGQLRTRHADCPRLDVLQASKAGVLPEDTVRNVNKHVEKCSFCQILLRDSMIEEFADASTDEARRVRQRVFAESQDKKAAKAGGGLLGLWFWRAIPVTVLSAMVVAFIVWLRVRPTAQPQPAQTTVAQQAQKPANPTVLEWEKLPIKLQASSILVLRGAPQTDTEKYAAELTAALKFYRDDQYAEAATALGNVTKAFPHGVEGQLYLGVTQLKLKDAAAAVTSLSAAQRLGVEQFRDDATWYLALAYRGTGDVQSAAGELQKLCEGSGSYAERACAGIRELGAQHRGNN